MRALAGESNELTRAHSEIAGGAGNLVASALRQFVAQAGSVSVFPDPIGDGVEDGLDQRIGRLFFGWAGHGNLHFGKRKAQQRPARLALSQ
jgi:hypothetical protein